MATWYKKCRVPFGVFLRHRIGKYQNSAILPFVEIRVIDALRKLQAKNEVEAATNIMIKRKDFNEFYYLDKLERQMEAEDSFGQPRQRFWQLIIEVPNI